MNVNSPALPIALGPAAGRISVLGIPTRDRPASLRRCLQSHLASQRGHHRGVRVLIADDSLQASNRIQQQQDLEALRQEFDVAIDCIDAIQRVAFAAELARRVGCPPGVAAFGLANPENYPVGTGASRNALLLHSVGELSLQVDDDTTCQLAPVPGAREEIVQSTRFDPTEFWIPGDAVTEAQPPSDLLGLHESLLGRSIAGSPPRQILLTQAGVLGDSGMGSSLHFLGLSEPSRSRVIHSEEVWRRTLSEHWVLRAVPTPTICSGGVCMALNLGMDNRVFLPPFLPVQRNQDGVFGALVRICCAGAGTGYLPTAVLHQPPNPRPRPPLDAAALTLNSGQLVQALILQNAPREVSSDTAANLRSLGARLIQLAGLSEQSFTQIIHRLTHTQLSDMAQRWTKLLQEHGNEPAYWAADVRTLIAASHECLREGRFPPPRDLAAAFGGADALSVMQRLVGRFGELLCVWPLLVEAARDLRSDQSLLR